MLKTFVAIPLILIVGHYAHGAAMQSDNVLYFSDRLRNVIKKHCLQNANETEHEKALEGLADFQRCWQLELPNEMLTGQDLYQYCLKHSEDFLKGLNKFVDKLSPCLDPQENYLKAFILNGYGNYNHFFCKHMEFLSVSETNKKSTYQCMDKFEENPEIDPLVACYKNTSIFGDNAHAGLITKHEFCEDILDVRCCYDIIFSENCPDAPEFADLKRELLTQALINCVDVLDDESEEKND